MKHLLRILISLVVPAVMLTVTVNPAIAQDKEKGKKAAAAAKEAPKPKVIIDNDKVRVQETRYKPGTGGPMAERPGRAVLTVKGGTFTRTYPDGKKVKIETKTGEWRWLEKETYSFENTGKTEIVLHGVYLK